MKKILPIIFLLIATTGMVKGQKWRYFWWEVELGGGMNLSFNDLSKWEISPVGTFSIRYKFSRDISAKLQVAAGQISGMEKVDTALIYRYTSLLVAPTLRFEYEIYRAKKDLPGYNSRGLDMDLRQYWVYLFGGIGGVYFEPVARDDLPEQNYKNYTWTLPLGAGYKYNFNRTLSVGAEIELMLTGSDYLEGFSPGHSSKNDRFFMIRAEAAYRFGTTSSASFHKR
jgi:hypothetical protein